MKPLFLSTLAVLFVTPLLAADPHAKAAAAKDPAESKAEAPDDLSSYQSADALWAHLQVLRKEPSTQPSSREEFLVLVKKWLSDQQAGAAAFLAKYPQDSRRYSAKMIALQASLQLSQIPGAADGARTKAEDVMKELASIIAAPDAPADAKGEASFVETMMQTEKLDPADPASVKEFLKASDAFLSAYGTHKLAPQMRKMQLQIASQVEGPDTEAILTKFSKDADAELAAGAQQILTQRAKMKGLKEKPLDLKFTAVDGKAVDLEKMRGKVVLVDFWASWCGPCMAEAPNVVATYRKLHEKGFEILGISLDQEKSAMEAAATKQGMSWTQYFDGKGWQNAISTSFGINSIPAAWLVDKKGMVRETSLRGEALEAGVEKLLAE